MAIGMLLTACSFFVLYGAAKIGEGQPVTPDQYTAGSFRINDRIASNLEKEGVPKDVLDKLMAAKEPDGKNTVNDVKFSPSEDEKTKQKMTGEQHLIAAVDKAVPGAGTKYRDAILKNAFIFQVSAFWLILAYAIISLGELMLSPMGLSLVSKVAPVRIRGLMMGGWFVATAIGNKLTMIGILWSIWYQSSFFLVLGLMAFVMSIVLALLLKPLKKAMPGV
jgi:hypothetical protein